MSERLIISISGMRGIVGDNLTAEIAENYGRAFGTYLRAKYSQPVQKLSVCIGRDSRPSGPMLLSAIATGLCSVGIDVVDLGIVTTPCVGIMIGELKCCGGVVITASHNPGQYNGIKLLLDNAVAPPAEEAEQIRQNYYNKDFVSVASADCGTMISNDKTDDVHIRRVLSIVDTDAIAANKFKVVLDSVNGAGGRITQKLLAELGCKVTAMNCEPTGIFAHTPEPTATNLTGLCEVVKAESAQIGFAQDPDADRLAIVDENGTYIGEEYTLALAAKYMFSKETGKAATNLSTSRMIDDIARLAGGEVIRTAVGEANVAAAMMENNCIIGGEGNGGVIDLRIGPIRNSLVGIALVLQLMLDTAKTIGELVADIGSYHIQKEKFPAEPAQAKQILELAQKRFADAEINTIDGCRFDFEDGWLHLRTSNTEPVMRVIAEAKEQRLAQEYIDAVLDVRRKICS